ncbi:putative AC9 transposase, partial [Bienertia sinuspersici]
MCTFTFEETFVCVSIHWIDDEWYFQKFIIYFEATEEAHNGFNIKPHTMNCCKIFICLMRFFSLSLNNGTANTRAIAFLMEDPSLSLLLNGSLLHIRCCVHILNLSVQEGVTQLQPLLEPIRNVINWIRVTRTTRRAYKTKCEEYGLKKKVCSLDTPTQWNLTYNLLNDAIRNREVLTILYNESCSDPNSLVTNEHWAFALVNHDVFVSFDNASVVISYVYVSIIHRMILECIKFVNSINWPLRAILSLHLIQVSELK